MPKLSDQKEQKIKEAILSLLFHTPKALFTAQISRELARDEEFIKKLLLDLEEKGLIKSVKRSSQKIYIKRTKWQLTPQAYKAYEKIQNE